MKRRLRVIAVGLMGIAAVLLAVPQPVGANNPVKIASTIARALRPGGTQAEAVELLLGDAKVAAFFRTANHTEMMEVARYLGSGPNSVEAALSRQIVMQLATRTENPLMACLSTGSGGGGCPFPHLAGAIEEAAQAAALPLEGRTLVSTNLLPGRARPRVYVPSYSTNYRYLQEARLEQTTYPEMNLKRIDPESGDWLWIDEQFAEQLEMKRKIFALRRDKVFAIKPGMEKEAREGSEELLAMISEYLPKHYPEHYRREGNFMLNLVTGERWNVVNPRDHPLTVAARMVQEDLTIVRQTPDGNFEMIAGCVHFPSGWGLVDFIGLNIDEIHGAVPGWSRIAEGVKRFLGNMVPERVNARNNWFFYSDPTLAQPAGRASPYTVPRVTADNVENKLFLRSERETLRKLPESGLVVFTIREHVYPLRDLEAFPEVAERFAGGIRGLAANGNPEYYADEVLGFLDRVTTEAAKKAAEVVPPASSTAPGGL